MHDVPGPRRPRASVRVHHLRHLRVHHVFGVHREFRFASSPSTFRLPPERSRRCRTPETTPRAGYLAGWYGTPRALVLPGGEHQEGTPQKLHPAGVPREEVRRRRSPPPKHKHKPKPTPRIRTERSVTPHRRCRPCARRRPPRARATTRLDSAGSLRAQGAGDNTRRSASVADAAAPQPPPPQPIGDLFGGAAAAAPPAPTPASAAGWDAFGSAAPAQAPAPPAPAAQAPAAPAPTPASAGDGTLSGLRRLLQLQLLRLPLRRLLLLRLPRPRRLGD